MLNLLEQEEAAFRLPGILEAVSVHFESLCKTQAAPALPGLPLVSCMLLFHTGKGNFYIAELLKLAGLLLPKSSPVVAMDPHSLFALCTLRQGGVLSSLTGRVTFLSEPLH